MLFRPLAKRFGLISSVFPFEKQHVIGKRQSEITEAKKESKRDSSSESLKNPLQLPEFLSNLAVKRFTEKKKYEAFHLPGRYRGQTLSVKPED